MTVWNHNENVQSAGDTLETNAGTTVETPKESTPTDCYSAVDAADATQKKSDSIFAMLRFYIPLVVSAISMSLTYPLVASIVSHGRFGALELSAFAMGQSVMFFTGSIGSALIPTGMVFAKTRLNMDEFTKLSNALGITAALMQAVVCIPPFDRLVFSVVLNLSDDLSRIAKYSLLLCIPAQLSFFLRNKYFVVLYNEKRSDLANMATMIRIALSMLLSPLFVKNGLTGYAWGSFAMTVPIILEALLLAWFAKPFLDALTDKPGDEIALFKKQFSFNLPLSFGGMLLCLSAFMIGIYISRPVDSELALKVHYVIMGVVNPVSAAAFNMRSVVIAFPPVTEIMKQRLFKFTLLAGGLLAPFPLLAKVDRVAQWYFAGVQNLDAKATAAAVTCMLLVVILPFLQALRGHAEGIAVVRRRPNAILAGQIAYMATITCSLQIFLKFNLIPGYMMGAAAIILAILITFLTIRIGLMWVDAENKYNGKSYCAGSRYRGL